MINHKKSPFSNRNFRHALAYAINRQEIIIIDRVTEPLIQHKRIHGSAARGCAGEALERMGLLSDQTVRFPHELSGGEIQRAMLAMAMIMEPELLILDEPTSAPDAMTKAFVA